MLKFFCYFICVLNAATASLVPFIGPCKGNDNDCLVAANIQISLPYLADGLSGLGIPSAEPMVFENITMEQGYFKLVLPHLKVFGFKKCRLIDFKSNQQAFTIKLTMDCPVTATSDYKFSGKICVFDIDKEGDFKLQTEAMRTTITIQKNVIVGSDGNKYWNLLNYEYVYEPLGSVHVELADLLAGDVSKAKFNVSVNEKWGNDVLKMGDPIACEIVKYFFNVLKVFFHRVPLEKIALY